MMGQGLCRLQAFAVVALLAGANVGWSQNWNIQQPDSGTVFKRNLGDASVAVTLQGSRGRRPGSTASRFGSLKK